MKFDKKLIKAHLPIDIEEKSLNHSDLYMDGITVMCRGEHGPDFVVYRAKDKEDLLWWQLESICCSLIGKIDNSKVWRWSMDHVEDGHWTYFERRHYDYNAIEDMRLPAFECYLRSIQSGFPEERREEKIQYYVGLMNRWFTVPHWDYDREKQCFVEISDSRAHHSDDDFVEEPRPGSIIKIID